MLIQPKPYIDGLRLRNKAIGSELRRNMSKKILDNSTPFPSSIEYKDIDDEFKKFVMNDLRISYNGMELPTYSLFSNQRISEYSQTWKYTDDVGNILMNFKTITRENNPQKGKIYGEAFNIPSDINFAMFKIPVLQENGQEAIDLYTMKQPFSVDFIYNLNIITNKYALLNDFNELVNSKFKGLQYYINPKEHPMSMVLESITDESEYVIDDRKFYSQSYKIRLRGYIIRKDDFKVEHLPSRVMIITEGDAKHKRNKWKNIEYYEDPCRVVEDINHFKYRAVAININYDTCDDDISFIIDINMKLELIEISNVFDFLLKVNGECIDINDIENIEFKKGDTLEIKISKDNFSETSKIVLNGYNMDEIVDETINTESDLDDSTHTEHILVN